MRVPAMKYRSYRPGQRRKAVTGVVITGSGRRRLRYRQNFRDGGINQSNGANSALKKLNANLEQRVEERTAELQRALALNEGVINALPDLLFELDNDGTYLNLWARDEKLLTEQKEILLGNNVGDFLPRDAVRCTFLTLDEVQRNGFSTGNIYRTDFPGEGERWYEISASRKEPEGTCLILCRDVSERKKQEESLAQKEREFRTLVENLPDNVIRYNRACRAIYVSPRMERVLGSEGIARVMGKTPREAAIPGISSIEYYQQTIGQVLASGEKAEIEIEVYSPSGEMQFHHIRFVAERDQKGEVHGVLAIGSDITERKLLEKEIADSYHFLNNLVDSIPDPMFVKNREHRWVIVNKALVALTGLEQHMLIGKSDYDVFPEAEADIFWEKDELVFNLGEVNINEEYLTSPDGVTYSIETVKTAFTSTDGEKYLVGNVRDITRRKKMEKSLAKQEQQFRTLAENSPDTIARYDRECIRTYVNTTFAKLAGVSVETLLGKKPTDYNLSPEAAAYETMLATTFASGEMGEVEYTWPDARGNKITSHVRFVPEYDDNGEVISVLATGRDITRLLETRAQLEHMARHDILTGLPNRQTVREETDRAIALARRHEQKVALLFIDLDNFKAINDSLGHATGDLLLQEVAGRLRSCVREIDTVGRQGGDEFVITLSEVEDADGVATFVSRFFQEFEHPFQIEENALFASLSIGIALFPDDGENFDTLMKMADTAMYEAKDTGRNTYSFFSRQMNRSTLEHLQLHGDLKRAMVADELQLHYQPQIDALSGRITGAEALLRWEHPEKGMIPPLQFIPLAESSGLIITIGRWIIEQACRQAAAWHEQGMELTVAVNISAVQFKRGDLVETVSQALEVSGLEARFLELELTESVIMQDTDKTLSAVRQLKRLGVRLAIDDFGTGYSSLAYLKRFAVDKLKIDRSFVRDIVHDDDDTAIVKAIIQMARSLGVATIAEGVEDQETLKLLQELGCDTIQGFLFAPALKATDFTAFSKEYSAISMAG